MSAHALEGCVNIRASVSADQLFAKGLVLIIYKELSKLNKKTNTHVRKW